MLSRTLLTILLVGLFPWCGDDARAEHYRPKLTNSKDQNFQDFPLGVLSATGRLVNGERMIQIIDVGAGGVADKGGLQVGDQVKIIQGQTPGPFLIQPDSGLDGPQRLLGMALDQACALKAPVLTMKVLREKKTVSLSFDLPPSPRFAATMPLKCEKTDAYLASIARHLVATQQANGSWRPGVGGDAVDYTASFCGLTLLAAKNPEHLPAIEKAVQFVRGKEIAKIDLTNSRVGPKNWIAAAAAIFLAEYHLATGDSTVLEDLGRCCDLLALRVSDNGTMGHHFEITYNGGGLTIINVQAHLAWALASRCGYEVKPEPWNRSLGEISKSITKNGGVGYSSRAAGDSDAPARTGCMAVSLALAEQYPAQAKAMGAWLERFNNRLPMAHTNCSLGLIFGTAGIKAANPTFLNRHLKNWLPYLELCRSSEEGAQYFGNKANYGGDDYLGFDAIGNATVGLMLASGRSDLFLFGGTKKGWFVESKKD